VTDVRRDRQLGVITPNMQRYDADKAEGWADAVARGLCPFCNAGPFVVVAQHTYQIHGVDRRVLRDMIGVYYSTSICDPTYSAGRTTHTNQLISEGVMNQAGGESGATRRLSKRRLTDLRERGASLAPSTHTPEIEERRKRTLKAVNDKRRAGRDAEIVQRLRTTNDSTRTIAALMGLAPTTIKRVARERGINLIERAADWYTPTHVPPRVTCNNVQPDSCI
jgi:hypothetical protein